MKLLIYWYSDGDLRSRKFLRRELIETPHEVGDFVIASMTEGAIWKHLSTWKVTEAKFEEQLRKPPADTPGAT